MRSVAWPVWGLVVALLMAGGTALADGPRLAVVNLEQLLKAHPDTAPAEASLEKQRQDFEGERRDMLTERTTLKEAFEASREEVENPALSDEARVEKVKAAQAKFQDLREYERKLQDLQMDRQKELNDQSKRLREQIVRKIRVVINAYAKDKKLDAVLNAEDGGTSSFGSVLYHTEDLDVTDEIRALIAKPE